MSIWSKLKDVSVGLFLFITQLWILANVPSWVSPELQISTYIVLLIYLMMYVYMFAVPDLRSKFFEVKLIHFMPKMMLWFVMTYMGLMMVGGSLLASGFAQASVGLGTALFWVIIIHAFIRSVVEETFFHYYLEKKAGLGWVGSNLVFAFFHFAIKKGHLLALVVMFVLGSLWSFIQARFSPADASANIGSHAGWDSAIDVLSMG